MVLDFLYTEWQLERVDKMEPRKAAKFLLAAYNGSEYKIAVEAAYLLSGPAPIAFETDWQRLLAIADSESLAGRLIETNNVARARDLLTMGWKCQDIHDFNIREASVPMLLLFIRYSPHLAARICGEVCFLATSPLAQLIEANINPSASSARFWDALREVKRYSESALIALFASADAYPEGEAARTLRGLQKMSITTNVATVIIRHSAALTRYGCTVDTDRHFGYCPGFRQVVEEYPHLCSEPESLGVQSVFLLLTRTKPAARI